MDFDYCHKCYTETSVKGLCTCCQDNWSFLELCHPVGIDRRHFLFGMSKSNLLKKPVNGQ